MESRARETAGCAEGSDAAGWQSQDENPVWPDWGSPGGGIASGTGGLQLPLQLWAKAPWVSIKKAHFFQFLLNSTKTVNKYSYHFRKWVRFCLTQGMAMLSMSTPPMLPHTEQHSGYLAPKRRYFSRKNKTWWAAQQHCYHAHQAGPGVRRKADRGEAWYCTVQVVLWYLIFCTCSSTNNF